MLINVQIAQNKLHPAHFVIALHWICNPLTLEWPACTQQLLQQGCDIQKQMNAIWQIDIKGKAFLTLFCGDSYALDIHLGKYG